MKNKKTVLITGASRGIGRAIAILFAKNNYNVVINYNKSEEEAKSLLKELESENCSARIFKADISKIEEANALVNYTIGQFEKIDILVNNAGISRFNLFTDISYDEWHEVMNVNLNSVFYVTKKALQYMIPEHEGKIINISSMWGNVGASCEVAYSASKGGVNTFTKALARELAPSNIAVNAIAFGTVDTRMNHFLDAEEKAALIEEIPAGRFLDPQESAEIIYSVATLNPYVTGQIITADGGLT